MTETKVNDSVEVAEKAKLSSTQVRESEHELTRMEELVVRMTQKYPAPLNHQLDQLTDMYPTAAAEIEEIQKRVLEACAPRDTPEKRSIISALRGR